MQQNNPSPKSKGLVIFVLFLLIMVLGVAFSLKNLPAIIRTAGGQVLQAVRGETDVSAVPGAFEAFYDSLYASKPWSLDAFSLTQSILGKRETRNFEVLKSGNGTLYLQGNQGPLDTARLEMIANQYEMLYNETTQNGGRFLYVRVPYKNVGQAPDLALYSADNTTESELHLMKLLREKGIPVLDLGNYSQCTRYYNTDHHWTVEAAFHASTLITAELQRLYGLNFPGREYYGNIENYTPVTYENCFLGSIGVKVGPYFGGKDDFTVFDPKFETNFDFTHRIGDQKTAYSGTFWEAFINEDVLKDDHYYNKYDANLQGAYVESIIQNPMAQTDYKGLLISHSYARPLAPYMALNYRQLRYLDPQVGRYNENYLDYIREFKPQVVVVMYDGPINVGDGNWPE